MPASQGLTVYIGAVIHSLSATVVELLPRARLGVCDNGKIAFLEKVSGEDKSYPDAKVIELGPTQFLAPGFVDTHLHAPQYPNAGIFGKSTLLDWLEKYTYPMEAKYRDLELASTVYHRLIKRGLENGTTTASYYGTSHTPATVLLAKVAQEEGQRALVGRVCMELFCPSDVADESPESALASDREFVTSVRELDPSGESVIPVITPRFAPSCHQVTLNAEGEFAAKHDLPVQTHISESKGEINWVLELFPEAESYADVYERAGLLGPRTILAHAVHLTEKELELIKQRKCGISHCPESNASIASGIAPVRQMIRSGLKCSLGTDVSGGSTVSILRNLRLALLKSRLLTERCMDSENTLSVNEGLYLATLGGAEVCGLDHIIGNFREGKYFDAQLVDVSKGPIDIFDFALPTDAVERLEYFMDKWVYIGDDRNTVKVWVAGKELK